MDFGVDTLDAIQLLHKRGRYPQFLVLLYSAIDTLGWLAAIDEWATGASFKDWVNRYMLPYDDLTCTAEDLWGARNALLHTATAESKVSRQGQARQIWYCGKGRSRELLDQKIGARKDVVPVRTVVLLRAFAEGTARFTDAINNDGLLADRVKKKSEHWLHWVPPSEFDGPAA